MNGQQCPAWCVDHPVIPDDATVVHRRQTSPEGAPYLVRVEQFPDAAPGIYVQDAHGNDITVEQARAFARALTDAAVLVEGVAS